MKVETSRILNEKSGFAGLTVLDIAVLGYSLVIIHPTLSAINLDIIAFFIVGIMAYFLVVLRMRSRRKTIRDFIRHKLARWGAR